MRLFTLCALTSILFATGNAVADQVPELEKLRSDRERLIKLVVGLEADFSATVESYGEVQADYAKLLARPKVPDQRAMVQDLQGQLNEAARKIREMQRLEKESKKGNAAQLKKLRDTLEGNLVKFRAELEAERRSLKRARTQLDEMRTLQIETRKVEEMLRTEIIGRSHLQADLQSLRGERDALVLRLEESMTRITQAEKGRAKAEARVAQLEKNTQRLNKGLKLRQAEMTKLKAEFVGKEKVFAKNVAVLKKKTETLAEKLAQQETAHQKARAEAGKRLEALRVEKQAQLKKNAEQSRASTLKIAALEKDKTRLQNELSKRETKLKKVRAEAQNKMSQAVTKLEQEKVALAEQLAKRDADLQKARKDLGKLHLRSTAMEKQFHALKVRFAKIDPVRYALGAADVRNQQKRVLRDVQEVIAMFPNARFEIVGHTCDLGSRESNLKLSQERATSLLAFLSTNGVASDILKSRGVADAEPLVPNTNESNRRRNRRVEVHILD